MSECKEQHTKLQPSAIWLAIEFLHGQGFMWVAQDYDGTVVTFSKKPSGYSSSRWIGVNRVVLHNIGPYCEDWKTSLIEKE